MRHKLINIQFCCDKVKPEPTVNISCIGSAATVADVKPTDGNSVIIIIIGKDYLYNLSRVINQALRLTASGKSLDRHI